MFNLGKRVLLRALYDSCSRWVRRVIFPLLRKGSGDEGLLWGNAFWMRAAGNPPACGDSSGGKDSSSGSGSAVLSQWLQPLLETLSIPLRCWSMGTGTPTSSPSPDWLFPHQRMQRDSLYSSLTFPLAPYILVGVNCFSKILFSYLFGGNVSGHYLTLEIGIDGKSDLNLSWLFNGPERVSQ